MITKVISGLQTGIDTLGLEVAESLGLECGGTGTPNLRQEFGQYPTDTHGVVPITYQQGTEFRKRYPGTYSPGQLFYLPRTDRNVADSDATVYFATQQDSAGAKATERYAKTRGKPFFMYRRDFVSAKELRFLLALHHVQVLNVAGNRGSKLTQEFRKEVQQLLMEVLS